MVKSSPPTSKLLATLALSLSMLSALLISGFTVAGFEAQTGRERPPNQGPAGVGKIYALSLPKDAVLPNPEPGLQPALPNPGSEEPQAGTVTPGLKLTNVIKNGDFEQNPRSDVATYWEPFNNGSAIYGWYAERWAEAVHSGKMSQLLEINWVEGYQPNRVIAIYQTVDVVPNADYHLTIHALMRSNAPVELRNQGDYAMQWGVDYRGTGKHNNVLRWIDMPLTEQLRLGSNGQASQDNNHLFFELITGTIHTTNTNRITLFIRGLKIMPTGTEVNFNVDDVSLIGPYFPPAPAQSEPSPMATMTPTATITPPAVITAAARIDQEATPPAEQESNLPSAGATRPPPISAGVLALGGLVLVALGTGAVVALLQPSKYSQKLDKNDILN